jgi:putative SOS response-associated peptidase YedK
MPLKSFRLKDDFQVRKICRIVGVWNNQGKEAVPYRSCTILTREASSSIRPMHQRMPVILKPTVFDAWLDTDNHSIGSLQDIIQNHIHTEFTAVPVSKHLNSFRKNRADKIKQMQLFPE